MKKAIAILLAVLSVFGCLAVFASADVEGTPAIPAVDDILSVDDKIKSEFSPGTVEVFYKIAEDDYEHITSALGNKLASKILPELTSFCDEVKDSFQIPVAQNGLGGVYTVLGIGSEVPKIYVDTVDKNGNAVKGYKEADDIKVPILGLDEKKDSFSIAIDYSYVETTYRKYYSLKGWKVVEVTDSAAKLSVTLEAQWEKREPTGSDEFVEKIYAIWLRFLDILGEAFLDLFPATLKVYADYLRNLVLGI